MNAANARFVICRQTIPALMRPDETRGAEGARVGRDFGIGHIVSTGIRHA
ncbi:hypothetical protein [Nocardia sp. CY41]|nr:hypothetical protein [Nocardia sp. CY41]